MFPALMEVMKRKNFSQKKMVNEMKKRGFMITEGGFSHKLNGTRSITISEMELIADILGETPLNLFFDSKYTKSKLS